MVLAKIAAAIWLGMWSCFLIIAFGNNEEY
jgi:hypothetical protein